MDKLTPEQADFILDLLEGDPEAALAGAEKVYEAAGAADAQSFLDDFSSSLADLAASVDAAEGE